MLVELPEALQRRIVIFTVGEAETLTDMSAEDFPTLLFLRALSVSGPSTYIDRICESTTKLYESIARKHISKELRVKWGLREGAKFIRKQKTADAFFF